MEDNIVKEIEPIRDGRVPQIIMDHIKLIGLDIMNPKTTYEDFLSFMPDYVEKPTFNQWIYHYNMIKLQKLIDVQYSQICKLRLKIKSLRGTDKKTDIPGIERKLNSLQQQYHAMTRDALKYSNDGINRETPRKLDVTVNKKVQLGDFHKLVREAKKKEAIDIDYRLQTTDNERPSE